VKVGREEGSSEGWIQTSLVFFSVCVCVCVCVCVGSFCRQYSKIIKLVWFLDCFFTLGTRPLHIFVLIKTSHRVGRTTSNPDLDLHVFVYMESFWSFPWEIQISLSLLVIQNRWRRWQWSQGCHHTVTFHFIIQGEVWMTEVKCDMTCVTWLLIDLGMEKWRKTLMFLSTPIQSPITPTPDTGFWCLWNDQGFYRQFIIKSTKEELQSRPIHDFFYVWLSVWWKTKT
jgi:hypothetical protein